MATPKKSTIWDVPELLKRTRKLLYGGILVNAGMGKFFEQIKDEFEEAIRSSGYRLFKKTFVEKVEELLWSPDVLRSFEEMIRHRQVDKFLEVHGHVIPRIFADRKERDLKGKSRSKLAQVSEGGVNRIMSFDDFDNQREIKLPAATKESPFVIPVKNKDNFKVMIASGLHHGTPYNPLIEENLFRQFLEEAELFGADAIVLSGGILHLDVKRASSGPLDAHRARILGRNTNTAGLDPRYREKAERIKREKPSDEVVYVTLKEVVDDLFNGLEMIARRSDDTPEFSGKVYVFFGPNEEELIEAAAQAMYSFITRKNAPKLRAELRMIDRAFENACFQQEIEELEKRRDVVNAEEQRTRVSFVDSEERNRFITKVLSYFVKKVQDAIPNSKVVGMGNSVVKIGGSICRFDQWRSTSISDGILDKFILDKAGQMSLEGSLPDAIFLDHPYSLNFRWAVMEGAENGRRYATDVWTLPSLVDKEFIAKEFHNVIADKTLFEKMLRHKQFAPGCVRLTCVNGRLNADPISVTALRGRALKRWSHKLQRGKKVWTEPKYINLLIDTDPHWGNAWKVFYYDNRNECWLGSTGAFIEMMRREGLLDVGRMPIHGFHLLDDGVHGNHFGTQSQPHQHHMTYVAIENHFRRISEQARKSGKPADVLVALEGVRQMALRQLRLRGEHWTESQVQEYIDRMIKPNLDFFLALLRRGLKSGVEFRGASYYLGEEYDRRDIGPISWGNGNHIEKTVNGEITEGLVYCNYLTGRLEGLPGCRAFRDVLPQLIKHPLYGKLHIGFGTVSAKGGYEWGLSLRSNPPVKSGMGDPLRNTANRLPARGNVTRFFQERHVVDISGDIHRYGLVKLLMRTIISCASGTDTDSFGEMISFSANNTGNMIVSIPVDGPESGDVRVTPITNQFLKEYFEEGKSVDMEAFIPNPV